MVKTAMIMTMYTVQLPNVWSFDVKTDLKAMLLYES